MTPSRTGWLPRALAPLALRPWLLDRGSLTRRLQDRCTRFEVRGVRQQPGRPGVDEAALVGLRPTQRAGVREVVLCCDGRPAVFAHSVLPAQSLRGPWRMLGRFGSRPLGAALFADPRVKRTPLRVRKLNAHHPLLRRACAHTGIRAAQLWARRSVFVLLGKRILVTEVFLPHILELAP